MAEFIEIKMQVKYCCKCKPEYYCLRTRKGVKSLEIWCGVCVPIDIKQHYNVEFLTEEDGRKLAIEIFQSKIQKQT